MKTFYTERDIEDMRAAGVVEIEVDDDVVLTDLAREKAIVLGLHMKRVEKRSGQPAAPGMPRLAVAPQMQLPPAVVNSSAPSPPAPTPPFPPAPATGSADASSELIERVKSGVIAKIGTTDYNGLLDQIIPQVLARLNVQTQSGSASGSASQTNNAY